MNSFGADYPVAPCLCIGISISFENMALNSSFNIYFSDEACYFTRKIFLCCKKKCSNVHCKNFPINILCLKLQVWSTIKKTFEKYLGQLTNNFYYFQFHCSAWVTWNLYTAKEWLLYFLFICDFLMQWYFKIFSSSNMQRNVTLLSWFLEPYLPSLLAHVYP